MIHILIKGEVQGVGFRNAVRSISNQMGIIGVIRNLSNGDVEIILEGTGCEALLKELKKAFRFQEEVKELHQFEII